MEDGPQYPVGKAIVVFLIIRLGEVGDDIRQATTVNGLGRNISVRGDLSAPSEPNTWMLLQQGAHHSLVSKLGRIHQPKIAGRG